MLHDAAPGPRRGINLSSSPSKRSLTMAINTSCDSKTFKLEKKSSGRGKTSKMNPRRLSLTQRSFMAGPMW